MKYLFGTTVMILIALSFVGPKCDHVFTQVEQATLKIERPSLFGSVIFTVYHQPTGVHEGKEIICVKCFQKQKQLIDYGQPDPGPALTEILSRADSCLFISGGTLKIDTSGFIRAK